MNMPPNFSITELTFSQTTTRNGIDNTPDDEAVRIYYTANIGLAEIKNSVLNSTGSSTATITGATTGGNRMIRNNTVDDVTKLTTAGAAGTKIKEGNFDLETGTVI